MQPQLRSAQPRLHLQSQRSQRRQRRQMPLLRLQTKKP
jgi:hypothetical protein